MDYVDWFLMQVLSLELGLVLPEYFILHKSIPILYWPFSEASILVLSYLTSPRFDPNRHQKS
jgi:hypothetical protein